jgi:hypothetical protein
LKKKYKELMVKAEDIFETGNILVKNFEEFEESIGFILEIDSYCELDIYIDNKEVYITIKEINTYLYSDISDVEDILDRIKRLSNEF